MGLIAEMQALFCIQKSVLVILTHWYSKDKKTHMLISVDTEKKKSDNNQP